MDKYGSYSYVYVIHRRSQEWGGDPDLFLVLDNPDEAGEMVNDLNNGKDAIEHPHYEYAMEAVPFKHHN